MTKVQCSISVAPMFGNMLTLQVKGCCKTSATVPNLSLTFPSGYIKPCPATIGLLLHRAPTLLWPVVILSLWRVLVTDSQTT